MTPRPYALLANDNAHRLPWRYSLALITFLALFAWAVVFAIIFGVMSIARAQSSKASIDAAYACTPSAGFGYVLIDDADGLAWTLTQPQAPQAITGASVTLDAVTWPGGSFNRGTGQVTSPLGAGLCSLMASLPASGHPYLVSRATQILRDRGE